MGVVSLCNTFFMNYNFHPLIELLKQYLCIQKPGEQAQRLMMPEGRIMSPNHGVKPQPSAVLLALYESNGQMFFPVIRRPQYNGIHSGQMALPGGKLEKTDTDLIATALRESHEEIGLPTDNLEVIGSLTELYIPVTNMQVLPVIGYLKQTPKLTIDPHEVDAVYEVNLLDLLNPVKKMRELWNIRGNNVNVPFYHLLNQKVWGATAMILSEFEQILRRIDPERLPQYPEFT